MFAEIQPADVYRQVQDMQRSLDTNRTVLYLLCVLVSVQLLAKFAIFTRVVGLLRRAVRNEVRTEKLLTLIEAHGETTDKKASSLEDSARKLERSAPAIKAATAEVVAKVEEGTAAVIGEVKKIIPDKTKVGNPEVL